MATQSTAATLGALPVWPTAPDLADVYVQLRLDIEPVPASRVRVSAAEYTVIGAERVKTRAAHGYNRQALKQYQEAVGWLLKANRVQRNDIDDLGVHVTFHVTGAIRAGDVDNYCKALLDACNRITWRDDQQVTRLTADLVRRSDDPHIDLVVYVTERKARDCETCGKPLTVKQIAIGQVYCSKGCYDSKQRKGTNRRCVTCGTEVYRQVGKSWAKDVYCSPECRAVAPGICRECGAVGVEQWTNRRFCSTECSVAWHRKQAPRSKPAGTCVDCGGPVFGRGCERCRACFIAHAAPKGRPPKRTGPVYDDCPDCGGRKRKTAQRCLGCFRKLAAISSLARPVPSRGTAPDGDAA